jgi:hypothetical protein
MYKYRYHIIVIVFLLFVGILLSIDRIPQDLLYHGFADKRKIFGIPNFWNVVSNVPMFFLGVIGIYLSLKNFWLRPNLVSKFLIKVDPC